MYILYCLCILYIYMFCIESRFVFSNAYIVGVVPVTFLRSSSAAGRAGEELRLSSLQVVTVLRVRASPYRCVDDRSRRFK